MRGVATWAVAGWIRKPHWGGEEGGGGGGRWASEPHPTLAPRNNTASHPPFLADLDVCLGQRADLHTPASCTTKQQGQDGGSGIRGSRQ